jgi:dTDP-glucose 4,6-dehydratase
MKKILILGGNSLSGGNLASFLINKNFDLILVNRSKPHKCFLNYHKIKKKIKIYKININFEFNKLLKVINREKPDYVFNFISQSMVAESWINPDDWFYTNSYILPKLYFSMLNMKYIKKIIHFSTPEVYGSTKTKIAENNNFNPSTPYGVSRVTGDHCAEILFKIKKLPIIITRASNVYGPFQKTYRIIPKIILFIKMNKRITLHGGGVSKRDFIYSDDVSSALYTILKKGIAGETYHISNKNLISIEVLAKKICKIMNVKFDDYFIIGKERLGKDKVYSLSNLKIKKLGWKSEYNLENGISETIKWVDTHYNSLISLNHEYVHRF